MFEHLRDSRDQQTFLSLGSSLRLSEVLDLTWMKPGRLELRCVQTLLENVLQAAAPEVRVSFSSHDEPRYRAALDVRVFDAPGRIAIGGVLNHWAGFPDGVDAGHTRIFLEPLAVVRLPTRTVSTRS